ncbi:MAG: tetratricopeptide repeat protein [Rhodospirillales bacterium]
MKQIFRPLATLMLPLTLVMTPGLIATVATTVYAMPSSNDAPPPAARNNDFNDAKSAIAKADWPTAISLLQKVTAKEPKNPEAFNLLGYATRKSGDARGSLQHYQTALSLDPKHLGANEYIGEAYLMLGDVAKAEEHLKRLDELCTFGCKEQAELKSQIESYKRTGKLKTS